MLLLIWPILPNFTAFQSYIHYITENIYRVSGVSQTNLKYDKFVHIPDLYGSFTCSSMPLDIQLTSYWTISANIYINWLIQDRYTMFEFIIFAASTRDLISYNNKIIKSYFYSYIVHFSLYRALKHASFSTRTPH